MILLNILDIQNMMTDLLAKKFFDELYLEEAKIITFVKTVISGKRNIEWYDTEEEMQEELVRWGEVRKYAFDLIKGKRTPSYFSISLKLPEDIYDNFIQDETLKNTARNNGMSLLMNIRYENDKLSLITGCSYKTFTIDKSGEKMWDEEIKNILKKENIGFEQI